MWRAGWSHCSPGGVRHPWAEGCPGRRWPDRSTVRGGDGPPDRTVRSRTTSSMPVEVTTSCRRRHHLRRPGASGRTGHLPISIRSRPVTPAGGGATRPGHGPTRTRVCIGGASTAGRGEAIRAGGTGSASPARCPSVPWSKAGSVHVRRTQIRCRGDRWRLRAATLRRTRRPQEATVRSRPTTSGCDDRFPRTHRSGWIRPSGAHGR